MIDITWTTTDLFRRGYMMRWLMWPGLGNLVPVLRITSHCLRSRRLGIGSQTTCMSL
jgi:hypothetical protein